MKASLCVGTQATISIEVTSAMRPAFDGAVVHDVCSTWDMARHLETAARAVLAPHLDDDEEGIGSHLSIDHVAPAPVGSIMRVEAEAIKLDSSTLVCAVRALDGDTVLASGTQVQHILPRTTIADIMSRAQARAGASDA